MTGPPRLFDLPVAARPQLCGPVTPLRYATDRDRVWRLTCVLPTGHRYRCHVRWVKVDVDEVRAL